MQVPYRASEVYGGANEMRNRRESVKGVKRGGDSDAGSTAFSSCPESGMGCPILSQACPHTFLTRFKAGSQVQAHSLLRVGRPWELFQTFPPGDPFSPDSGGPSLPGFSTCSPAPWPVSSPATLVALGVDSPWVPMQRRWSSVSPARKMRVQSGYAPR